MSDLFESSRLVYKALDNTQADKDFIYSSFQDPSTLEPGSLGVARPWRRQQTDDFLETVTSRSLLAVKICLRPSADTVSSDDTASMASSQDTSTGLTTIGFLGMRGFNPGAEPTLQTTVGPVYIDAAYRRKGYATEAMNWLLDWAFRNARLHRVALQINGNNKAADALYRGLGFVEEGRLRDAHYFAGKWADVVEFAMLEDEWRQLRAAEEDGVVVAMETSAKSP